MTRITSNNKWIRLTLVAVTLIVPAGCMSSGEKHEAPYSVPQPQVFPDPISRPDSVQPAAYENTNGAPNGAPNGAADMPEPNYKPIRHRGSKEESFLLGAFGKKQKLPNRPPQNRPPANQPPAPAIPREEHLDSRFANRNGAYWKGDTQQRPDFAEALPTTNRPGPSLDNVSTIDLSQALSMGGANHMQIKLARERVIEAHANLSRARSLWLPDLRLGVGYSKHVGRLQETQGNVLEISRNSLFMGGGVGLGDVPLAGGAGGPPRLFVNLSLADAIWEPLVADRKLTSEFAGETATMNDSLKDIAVAYFDLLEAHGKLANADETYGLATEMVRTTTLFAQQGAGTEASVDLAKTEQAFWQQQVQDAERLTVERSAELARLLRLDPRTRLLPAEVKAVPVHLVDPSTPVDQLLAWGMSGRPELARIDALVDGSAKDFQQERWRPLLPYLQVGASAGSFGGGPSSVYNNEASRTDVEMLAVWQLDNFGFGTLAEQRASASRLRQTEMTAVWIRDRVASEIVTASNDVNSYQRQIDTARKSVKTAGESYDKNFGRVRNGAGLPIELLQAIRSLATALDAYNTAVANYNRSQVQLLRAIGQPPSSTSTLNQGS